MDRDVADVLPVRKTDALRKLIDQLAVRTSAELNLQELGSILGVQRPTLENWLDVLDKLSLIRRLPAWTSGEAGREIRHATVHFLDTGIVAALRNMPPAIFQADAKPALLGGILETFAFGEILKNLPYQQDMWRLYHWRDSRGREIDVLAEAGRPRMARRFCQRPRRSGRIIARHRSVAWAICCVTC